MAERIVVFGATGYTGDLTARALVRAARARSSRPATRRACARWPRSSAGWSGRWPTSRARTPCARCVERGDVLVSTVGPFARWGEPAVQAAIGAGAHYLDSTGEGSFIRDVFERYGAGAQAAGCGLVTAFGYDWVPGNLAGALALRDAGEAATRVRDRLLQPGDRRRRR